MRKSTLTAVATVAAALVLAGCSTGAEAPSDSGELATKDTKASINYAIWNAQQKPVLDEIISAFNEEFPDIEVNVQVTPYAEYFTKLKTQASSKTLPDVFSINGLNVEQYMSNDLMAPVTPLVDADQLDPADYPEALIEGYSQDDTWYAVPLNSQTIAMWYNKAIFEEAGVDLPTADWTWEDLHLAAKTISDDLKDEGVYGIATDLTGQQAYYNTILQAGGFVISDDKKKSGYDDPKSIEGLQFWADLIADGSSPSVQQLSDTPASQQFKNGKAAMMFDGSWSVADVLDSPVKDDADVAPMPKGATRGGTVSGTAAAVSAHSPNIAAARAFQAFLGSQEAQSMMAAAGLGNAASMDAQAEFVNSAPQYNLQVFADAGEYAAAYPTSTDTAAWNLLETSLLPDAFSGARPVATVAQELAAQMNELLAPEPN